jgi:hypothetical protein
MRFAEKSFEVRFCAALSAAMMPFNRYPLWYGMTQAQERASGIDTMLRHGGDLVIFQFKAKQGGKFTLERDQWRVLTSVARKYPESTYYVFPEAEDTITAASYGCLLERSWCAKVTDIGPAFRYSSKSVNLTLNAAAKSLEKKRPTKMIAVSSSCGMFGCFCTMDWSRSHLGRALARHEFLTYFFGLKLFGEPAGDVYAPALEGKRFGIPIGRKLDPLDDREPITERGQLERLFSDSAEHAFRGLWGLFLPHSDRTALP